MLKLTPETGRWQKHAACFPETATTVNDSHPLSHAMCLNDIKLRIDARAYVVDPRLVAEAVLRRGDAALWLTAGARSPSAPADPARRGT